MNYFDIDDTVSKDTIIGLTLSLKNYNHEKYYDYTIIKVENNRIYINGNYLEHHSWDYLRYPRNQINLNKGDNKKIIEYIDNYLYCY